MLLRNPRVVFLIVGGLLAALAAVSLRVFSGAQLPATLGGSAPAAAEAALTADDVQVIGHRGGRVRWRLSARSVALSRDRRVVTLTTLRRGILYAEGGRPAATLTADGASYSSPFGTIGAGSAGLLRVEGHVAASVRNQSHTALRTRLVVWDSGSETLSCPETVSAALPKLSVTAGNAQYTLPSGNAGADTAASGSLRLGAGVAAKFQSTHGLATLSCGGLTWDGQTQSAQTLGPVTAALPGGLGAASADSITVSTCTGDLSGHGLRGTLRLAPGVE